MKKKVILIAALAALSLAYLWYFSDENIVLRKSETLIECFDKETGARGLGSSNFLDLLHEKVAISLPDDEADLSGGLPRDRATLTAIFSSLMRSADDLVITKQSLELASISNDQAVVMIRFHAKVSFPRYSKNDDLLAKITFIHSDGTANSGWKINRISITE